VIPMDWRLVILNMLTIKGIYGREVYETWYKMTVMLEYLVCRLLTTI
jgi:threonine 3-dehydrogenase